MRGNLAEILHSLGKSAALPGVKLAIGLLQELEADLEGEGGGELLAGLEADADETNEEERPRPKVRTKAKAKTTKPKVKTKPAEPEISKYGWPDDPAERSREMKRRMAIAKKKREAKVAAEKATAHRAALSKAAKKRWEKKTPAQRAAWQESMQRGHDQLQSGRKAAA